VVESSSDEGSDDDGSSNDTVIQKPKPRSKAVPIPKTEIKPKAGISFF
jgi:hypothetical protein